MKSTPNPFRQGLRTRPLLIALGLAGLLGTGLVVWAVINDADAVRDDVVPVEPESATWHAQEPPPLEPDPEPAPEPPVKPAIPATNESDPGPPLPERKLAREGEVPPMKDVLVVRSRLNAWCAKWDAAYALAYSKGEVEDDDGASMKARVYAESALKSLRICEDALTDKDMLKAAHEWTKALHLEKRKHAQAKAAQNR